MKKLSVFIYYILCIGLNNCADQPQKISNIESQRIEINNDVEPDKSIEDFIKPYTLKVNKDMDSVLAFSPKNYSKKDGQFNTAIGNFMADVVLKESQPIFKNRTGLNIDMVLLNYGGIRSTIPEGPITTRTAYEVMPFENEVIIATLKGEQIFELIDYLVKSKKPHPISGLKIELDANRNVNKASINNKEIDLNTSYNVATSDYLYRGGDRMDFFSKHEKSYPLDYKIRNVLIDYFKKIDTLDFETDDRFVMLSR